MKKYFLLLIGLSIFFTSCNVKNSESERLKAQNDSLVQAKQAMETEMNEYVSAMAEIQDNIDKIKDQQNVISVQPLSENTPEDVKEKVKNDITFLNDLITKNQTELENLRTKLKRSSFKLTDVEKTLAKLTKQLQDESAKVAKLQMQLVQKDSVINQLGTRVTELDKNVNSLSEENIAKAAQLKEQDEAMNAAWYAIGSKKELRDNKIVSSDGIFSSQKVLQSDFNKNYFVKIDTRTTKQIPLYSTSKAKILTNHPKSSYALDKNAEGYVLLITDSNAFWATSRYLVIEID